MHRSASLAHLARMRRILAPLPATVARPEHIQLPLARHRFRRACPAPPGLGTMRLERTPHLPASCARRDTTTQVGARRPAFRAIAASMPTRPARRPVCLAQLVPTIHPALQTRRQCVFHAQLGCTPSLHLAPAGLAPLVSTALGLLGTYQVVGPAWQELSQTAVIRLHVLPALQGQQAILLDRRAQLTAQRAVLDLTQMHQV